MSIVAVTYLGYIAIIVALMQGVNMNWDKGCYECYEYEIVSETETYYLCRCIRCGNFFKTYK